MMKYTIIFWILVSGLVFGQVDNNLSSSSHEQNKTSYEKDINKNIGTGKNFVEKNQTNEIQVLESSNKKIKKLIIEKKNQGSIWDYLYLVLHLVFIFLLAYLYKQWTNKKYDISVDEYFSITENVENKVNKVFSLLNGKEFSQKLSYCNRKLGDKEKCDNQKIELLKRELCSKDDKSYTKELKKISNIFMFIFFSIGLVIGASLLGQTNINLFLFRSIFIPIFILIIILILRTKQGKEFLSLSEDFDFYEWVLKNKDDWKWFQSIEKHTSKINFNYRPEYKNIFIHFSRKELPKFGIAYALGLFIATQIIFIFGKVEFVYPSTYIADEPSLIAFFSFPWEGYFSNAVPKFYNNIHLLDREMALFLTMTIIWWVLIPRVILKCFNSLKLHRELYYSLLNNEKNKTLFQKLLKQTNIINRVEEEKKKESEDKMETNRAIVEPEVAVKEQLEQEIIKIEKKKKESEDKIETNRVIVESEVAVKEKLEQEIIKIEKKKKESEDKIETNRVIAESEVAVKEKLEQEIIKIEKKKQENDQNVEADGFIVENSVESQKQVIHKNKEVEEKKEKKDYSIILWKKRKDSMGFNEILEKEEELKEKAYDTFSLGLFKQSKEEKKNIIEALNKGLIIFIIDASVQPSGEFEDVVSEVLNEFETRSIWVLPIKKEILLHRLHGDSHYDDWAHWLNENMKNKQVRMYDER